MSLKNAWVALQNSNTWTKKSGKGRIEWEKVCIDVELLLRRHVNTNSL